MAEHPIVVVVGAAGSGKSTAVAQLADDTAASAWLTLDERDRAPRRFIQYLARSLGRLVPSLEGFTADCLGGGLAPEDCAALLGERVPAGALVVLDDVHALEESDATQKALAAFVGAVPDEARVVLISRVYPFRPLARAGIAGHVGVIGDADLAFDRDEVEAVLEAQASASDADAVLRLTNGWAAGVAFEVLRGPDPSRMAPMRREMLFAYLSQEVLGGLEPELRTAVVSSGALDAVTPRRLERLLDIPDGEAAFNALYRLGLPGNVDDGVLRWHPLFREFLSREIENAGPGARRAILTGAAAALSDEGEHEDAVGLLLEAGASEQAARAAAKALPGVLRRGDWDTALQWIDRLDPAAPATHPEIRLAQILARHACGRQAEAAALIDEITATGELSRFAGSHPEVVAQLAWARHESGDWREALEMLPPPGGSPSVEAIRLLLVTGSGDEPVDLSAVPPGSRRFPISMAMAGHLWFRGQFDEAQRLVEGAEYEGPVAHAWTQFLHVTLLLVRGDLTAARDILRSTTMVNTGAFQESWTGQRARLLAEEDDTVGAVFLIRQARDLARTRRVWLSEGALAFMEGQILVRGGRFAEALTVLRGVREWSARRGIACCREWAEAWMGGALLGLGRDAEALTVLEDVVPRMQAADRLLELPAAAVFLAEARWRGGDPAGHEESMRLAVEAATRMGTRHPLTVALCALPEVRGPVFPALRPDGHSGAPGDAAGSVRLRTFGAGTMEIDGRPVTGRLGRSLEVASEIARSGSRGVERSRLIDHHLLDSRNPENALRQLLHRLRRRLPTGVELETAGSRVRFSPPGAVVCDDVLVEQMIVQARRESGTERTRLLRSALALSGEARYLATHDTESARERRDEIDGLVAEARAGLTETSQAERGTPGPREPTPPWEADT